MPSFRFKRLEQYRVGGTPDRLELRLPAPTTASGKVYRWCPGAGCAPRLFLLGTTQQTATFDVSLARRAPNLPTTTCPYCGIDSDDASFEYAGDISAVQEYVQWAVMRDADDWMAGVAKSLNRSLSQRGPVSVSLSHKPIHTPAPKPWREDLIRNLACDNCGREYGVYAIGLFCPDCGTKNMHVHFEREIELVFQQIDLAEHAAEEGHAELSYRLLGNAHEDVVTAFETYQKVYYVYAVRRDFAGDIAVRMTSKSAIGTSFQNPEKAVKLYAKLSVNPYSALSSEELEAVVQYIRKRHVIGHNLSMSDEAYSQPRESAMPGVTVRILADEVSAFAQLAKKVVIRLEDLT